MRATHGGRVTGCLPTIALRRRREKHGFTGRAAWCVTIPTNGTTNDTTTNSNSNTAAVTVTLIVVVMA